MTMIEKVALAIWQKKMNTKDGIEIFNRLTAREEWLDIARAAIHAMWEPTDEMEEARYAVTSWGGLFEYEDMIGAALADNREVAG